MSKVGVKNPLFLLDEVDKMGMDHRGDPASALLEVLDPEQNKSFNDHYLEVDYDLSEVMFICTANSMNIPAPLMDRMEIIRIPGYTEDEKLNIAEKYLLPKQLKKNGVQEGELELSADGLREIIRYYTREAGTAPPHRSQTDLRDSRRHASHRHSRVGLPRAWSIFDKTHASPAAGQIRRLSPLTAISWRPLTGRYRAATQYTRTAMPHRSYRGLHCR